MLNNLNLFAYLLEARSSYIKSGTVRENVDTWHVKNS